MPCYPLPPNNIRHPPLQMRSSHHDLFSRRAFVFAACHCAPNPTLTLSNPLPCQLITLSRILTLSYHGPPSPILILGQMHEMGIEIFHRPDPRRLLTDGGGAGGRTALIYFFNFHCSALTALLPYSPTALQPCILGSPALRTPYSRPRCDTISAGIDGVHFRSNVRLHCH